MEWFDMGSPPRGNTAPEKLLRRLEWKLGRRLDGRLQGAYRTVWHGAGIDFTDLRLYSPDDDVRHIDWNVTARVDEPHVRLYTEDREMTAWLVVDRSASMRFGGHDGKESVATELAIGLGRLVSQGGNRVGAILFDNDAQQVIPPRTGRDQILRITRSLLQPGLGQKGRTTDLSRMLRLAGIRAGRRSWPGSPTGTRSW
jgi:uncharacterized protein (DUF58 family)